jgi:hypothetical protein
MTVSFQILSDISINIYRVRHRINRNVDKRTTNVPYRVIWLDGREREINPKEHEHLNYCHALVCDYRRGLDW